MDNLVDQVRDLYYLDKEAKKFLGGIPFSDNIKQKLDNYKFLKEGLPNRKRIAIGTVAMKNDKVIGYHSFTILRKANPTQYEKNNIKLKNKLNYVQIKEIIVHPMFRNQGVAMQMMEEGLTIAKEITIPYVGDMIQKNKSMANLFSKLNFQVDFNWKTPNNTLMYRVISHIH